jgi:hypothetical protein
MCVLFEQQTFNATVQHMDVCVILPVFSGFIVSVKLLKRLGAFRESCHKHILLCVYIYIERDRKKERNKERKKERKKDR